MYVCVERVLTEAMPIVHLFLSAVSACILYIILLLLSIGLFLLFQYRKFIKLVTYVKEVMRIVSCSPCVSVTMKGVRLCVLLLQRGSADRSNGDSGRHWRH